MFKRLVVIISMLSSVALAQSNRSSTTTTTTTTTKERRATINFEDELVEGGTQKPELFYLFQKKNFNYGRLIKLRENFLPEMRKTTEDVQRVRGGN
ncbi:MAG: hypothetical protein ACLGGX_02225 [Bdellovibrionia bacterium]